MTSKTDRDALLKRMKQAAKQGIPASQREAQRVSFVLASLDRDSEVTRDQVAEWIAKQPA
jgi:hypothetical protein